MFPATVATGIAFFASEYAICVYGSRIVEVAGLKAGTPDMVPKARLPCARGCEVELRGSSLVFWGMSFRKL
jgi:hypothetical protein